MSLAIVYLSPLPRSLSFVYRGQLIILKKSEAYFDCSSRG